MKILMVCLGNICRSPLAEGILKSKVSDDVFVDSAGTSNWHTGKLPDRRSIEIAKKHGIDITNQKARQIQLEDFEKFDRIYVMDQSNYEDVIALAPTLAHREKVKLILSELNNPQLIEVPDPYYGGEEGFQYVFDLLDRVTDQIVLQTN